MDRPLDKSAAAALGAAIRPAEVRHGRHEAEGPTRLVKHFVPAEADELLSLQAGLLAPEARIASKYFYDTTGCALFADICRLPEYYLTRTEAAIFTSQRRHIARHLPSGCQWLDLGCGDGRKSHPWLEETAARRFIGVDAAQDSLVQAVEDTARAFSDIECLGVVTDLSLPLQLQPILAECATWPAVFFYPGSSLGNFSSDGAVSLLTSIREHLDHRGALLIGLDLLKDEQYLEAAYDDRNGVTAAFNRNILNVVNRIADADFEPERFEHRAIVNRDAGRVEMRLHAREAMHVRIGRRTRQFACGESILTEYSHKYSVDGVFTMLDDAGFGRHHVWTDEHGWFGVFLAQP